MKRYIPKEIEPKWQQQWAEDKIYEVQEEPGRSKRYVTAMFPYPSGAGLHVGHVRNYSITDAIARFQRQNGQNTLTTIGWDGFGLPAENYAIKTGTPPAVSTAENIKNFKAQLSRLGMSYDWSRELNTTDPDYYKWTQYLFLKLFEQDLAYQKESLQWWCPHDKTVLANEQVENGRCWRCGHEVIKKYLKQWFFRITAYADALLDGIDDLDWPEKIKTMQRNWIGRSTGAEIEFKIASPVIPPPGSTAGAGSAEESSQKTGEDLSTTAIASAQDDNEHAITVFTTRPDTLFGATFLVLAPEHPLVEKLATPDRKEAVLKYKNEAVKKSEIQRQENKEKTGEFIGAYAINPVNGEKMPIWTADYVLFGYGTGAIMAVPGHDERDHEFAQAFGLSIVPVVIPDSPQDLAMEYASDDISGATKIVGGDVLAFWPDAGETEYTALGRYIDRLKHGNEVFDAKEGVLINSGTYNGMPTSEAREQIVTDLEKEGVAREQTNYKMRDWLISRQRYWGAPIPIIHCPKDGAVAVPEADLPVVLPAVKNYEPDGSGKSVLAKVDDWVNVSCPKCGGPGKRETDTMDGYVDSSWYLFRYADAHNQTAPWDPAKVNYWAPLDFYCGGDHAVAHLLYVRFWTHFFEKMGLVDFKEPIKRLVYNGYIYAADGTKMSKSKGNVVDPLEVVDSGYGADALRTYELFCGPYEQDTAWDPGGVAGTFRFLQRLWTLVQEYDETDGGTDESPELERLVHRTIKKVTHDMEQLSFNTAIAALMECVNGLYKLKAEDNFAASAWQWACESLVQLVAPFAPHIAEELWEQLGGEGSVHLSAWPTYDEKYLVEDTVTIAVQVNGRLRGTVEAPADSDEAAVTKLAQADAKIAGNIEGKQIVKAIYVPGRLLNFVVR